MAVTVDTAAVVVVVETNSSLRAENNRARTNRKAINIKKLS